MRDATEHRRRSRRGVASSVAVWGVVGTLGLLVYACRAPTQVTLELQTPQVACADLKGVTIVVAATADEAERRAAAHVYTAVVSAASCASPTQVGTLVVTPDTERGAVVVVAGIANDASACTPDNGYAGCVVARRAFSFIDHVGTRVPIAIDPACVDVPCTAQSTCVDKVCRSSDVFCDESGNCLPPGQQPDGGVTFVDAGPQDGGGTTTDGGSDGGAKDSGPNDDGGSKDGGGTDGGGDGGTKDGGGTGSCAPACSLDDSQGVCGGDNRCCLSDGPPYAFVCDTCKHPYCCLGKSDCPAGQQCCANVGGGASCAITCVGTTPLCRNDGECQPNEFCDVGMLEAGGQAFCTPM